MLSKFKLKKVIFIFLLIFVYLSQIGLAGEQIVLSPDGTNSNQNQINKALDQAASQAEGITVFLTAGEYETTGPVYMRSNTKLTGDKNAIIKVSSSSSQWFTGTTGIICNKPGEIVNNIEVSGFQINGNCVSLNPDMANTPGHDKDCERCIIFHGDRNNYAQNIIIHDMKLYDSFSDGLYIYYAQGVHIYNMFISNCQHEGSFWSCVNNGLLENCQIAGITSDCARLDNCQNCKITGNVFFSYTGNHNNGAYKEGNAGIQIGDAQSSHGYDASDKPQYTINIEVTGNTFANIKLDSVKLGKNSGNNVYIHDNKEIGKEALETMGIPVDVFSGNYTPTKEMSEEVFTSIFDILDAEITDTGRTDQTAEDVPMQVAEKNSGIIAGGVKIVGFKDKIILDNISYIPDESAVLVQSKVIQNPDMSMWTGTIKKIDKDISTKIDDGTAYATLKVKTSWYTVRKNSITGEKQKSKIKTQKKTFKDSCSPAPDILIRDETAKAKVFVFADTKNPIAKVRIAHSNTTQRIEFNYEENKTTRTFLLGERIKDEAGLQYTAYSRCNTWSGNIPHMGNELIITGPFDPAKLHIIYYTPYESFEVDDVEVIYHENKGESQLMITLKFIVQVIIALFAGYKIMDIIIN